MIITWMLAATLFAVFVGIAAHASERALRLLGRQARAPWMLALAATLCWPLLAPLAARVLTWPSSAVPAAASPVAMSAVRIVSGGLSAAPGFWSSRVDVTLLALWAAFSGLLLLRLALSLRALSRIERGARQQLLEGASVLVTGDIGPIPISVGGLRP